MSDKETYGKAWEGGDKPYESSYGKLMMWFFLITDTLTFSAFLAAYGFSRFKFEDVWPIAEEVFTHFPFLHGEHPLLFVALMTFILIMSSVTMVLAVNFGHKMQKNKVILWLSLTIVGGIMFLGSQAWEWGHFIHGDKGGIETNTEYTIHIAEGEKLSSVYKLGRVRILLKEPRSTLSWHRDPEPRLHIPIITNPGCLMVIDNVAKHLPADGSVWITNNSKYHNAFNGGEENRIHLVACVLDYKFN